MICWVGWDGVMVHVLLLLGVLVLLGCPGSSQVVPVDKRVRDRMMSVAQWQSSNALGNSRIGMTWWFSRSGRFAVIYIVEDTDNNGKILPRLTTFGRFLDDQPVPYLFDYKTKTMERFERFVAAGPNRVLVALSRGKTIWIVDTASDQRWSTQTWPITQTEDGNACLRSRRLHLDHQRRAWFIHQNERDIMIVDLATGKQQRAGTSAGRPWRLQALGSDQYVLGAMVARDTDGNGTVDLPKSSPNCVCLVCEAFAKQPQPYGWTGDAFSWRAISKGQSIKVPAQAQPMTAVAVGDANDMTRYWALDAKFSQWRTLPEACRRIKGVISTDSHTIIRCGRTYSLYNTRTHRVLNPLPNIKYVPPQRSQTDSNRQPALFVIAQQKYQRHLAHVDLTSGALRYGPKLEPAAMVTVAEGGWFIGVAASKMAALHITQAAHLAGQIDGLARMVGNVGYLKQPTTKTRWIADFERGLWASTTQLGMTSPNGCMITPSKRQAGFEFGPWTLRCLEKRQ